MMSFNLLPPDRKLAMARSAEFGRWQPAMIGIAAFSLGLLGLTFFANAMLVQHERTVQASLASSQTSGRREIGDITAQTSQLNQTISDLTIGLPQARSWSADLTKIITLLPDDISITNIKMTNDGHLTLEGLAKTRLAFLSLQTILTSTPILKNVNTSSTASRRDNVPFSYTATLAL